jgi:dienelactone hydrolase
VEFDYDRSAPLDAHETATERRDPVTIAVLTIAGPEGREDVTLIRPDDPNGAGVILAHGGTDDGRHWFVDSGVELAAAGYTVALPATRSRAEPDVAGTERLMRRYVIVHRRALDLLADVTGGTRLGYYGHSVGALQGALLVTAEPRLRAAVLAAYGSGTLERLITEDFGADTPLLPALLAWDPARLLSAPHEVPLLLQFGRRDESARPDEGEALARAASPPVTTCWYDCDHGIDADPQARADRRAFFDEHLLG